MLSSQTWPDWRGDAKSGTQQLLNTHNIASEEYRMGKTKVFIRNPTTLFTLESKREQRMPYIATYIQKRWRGYIARKNFERLRASVFIQRAWRGFASKSKWNRMKAVMRIQLQYKKYKSNKWLVSVIKLFQDVKKMDLFDLGKSIKWPQHPPLLKKGKDFLYSIWKWWRAGMLIKSLNQVETAKVKQKILTYDLFHGKKIWKSNRPFEADYLSFEQNPTWKKYKDAIKQLFLKYGDSQILFADFVHKLNSGGKTDYRALVVTEKSIYKQDPKNYKIKRYDVPLSQITDISLSPKEDSFVVLHANKPYRDMVVDLALTGEERYSEFVTVIVSQIKNLNGVDVPVKFVENITFNNSRNAKSEGKPYSITFAPTTDPKKIGCTVSGGGGKFVISYNTTAPNVKSPTARERGPTLTKSQ